MTIPSVGISPNLLPKIRPDTFDRRYFDTLEKILKDFEESLGGAVTLSQLLSLSSVLEANVESHLLAIGNLTTTSSTAVYGPLASSPASTKATVTGFVLTNKATAEINVDVIINDGTTDYHIVTKTVPAGDGSAVIVVEALGGLSSGDSIKLQPSSANSLNYYISGLES